MDYLAAHENEKRGTMSFPIGYYNVSPNHTRYTMSFHWHLEHELILVRSGTFTLTLGTTVIELKAGQSVLIPDGIIHGGVPHNCVYDCAVFDYPQFLQSSAIARNSQNELLNVATHRQQFFANGTKAGNIVEDLFDAIKTERVGYQFHTIGLLWQLMGELMQETASVERKPPVYDKRTEPMKQVLRRIRRDYDKALTLEDLATEAAMAPKYFCRVFKELTGRTPIDYLNYYRIECAGELLRSTSDAVTEIALSCGFNDSSYFARTFKKYKGISAQGYRGRGSAPPVLTAKQNYK